jgi:hypothetical protein
MSHEYATFRESAAAYCDLIDSAPGLSRGQFLRQCSALAEVYGAASRLPTDVVPATDALGEERDDGSCALEDRLSKSYGSFPYAVVFDPFDEHDAKHPVTAVLMRDLAEIYDDLASALDRTDDADGLWDTRFAFDNHWGYHATFALHALHHLVWTAGAQWIAPED